LLYATARTTTTSLDTTLLRFNDTTGAKVNSFNIGRDSWSFQVAPDGLVYLSGNGGSNTIDRIGPSSLAAFAVSLSSPSSLPVTVDYDTTGGSADAGSDYTSASGTISFAPGQTVRTILVQTVDDVSVEPNQTFSVTLSNATGASITDGTGVGTIIDNDTKFYVVDDGATNRTFEYGSFADGGGPGAAGESYGLIAGNAAPRGAASTAAGDKVWVVDANRNVYVYDAAGILLGSWTPGTLPGSADVQGVATNGVDIWIVDAKGDKVYRFANAATRLTGSQNAASSFALNNSNKDATDIVTDGVSFWVVNNAAGGSSDKVFKYSLSGNLQGSWTILAGGGSPTGITLDPSSPSHLWIVDNTTDRVYQYDAAASRTSGSQSASASFALAASNTNPQGIADPPVASGDGAAAYDAALLSLFDEYLASSKRKRR